jgi:hypothetical protein
VFFGQADIERQYEIDDGKGPANLAGRLLTV